MALLRKLFFRKPPDGLLEISERVYVFDCCFTTDAWGEEDYKSYVGSIVAQLRENYPDASILVFNFRELGTESQIANVLSEYDITIMDYPRQYEGCPLLKMEVVHHFLRSSESWLSLGQQNVLLMHCERGGWPVLAFILAALLLYRKQYTGEQRTLDMIYKQAPRELLHLLSPMNPIPSQLRYLQYVSRRNVAAEWPPLDRALYLDCVIIRLIPNFDGEGGCRPIFRIYGPDPSHLADRTPKILFSTPKRGKTVRYYKQGESELVKIDINCAIQGDVVLECIRLHDDMEWEEMMFRVMFNTGFIRSNILMINRDEIDTLWDARDRFPKDFRAEVLFSDMDTAASTVPVVFPSFEEKDGLPMEAFAKVQEIFSNVDWLDPKKDPALDVLQQITASNSIQEKPNMHSYSHQLLETVTSLHELNPEKLPEKQKSKELESSSNRSPILDVDHQYGLLSKLSPVADVSGQKREQRLVPISPRTPPPPSHPLQSSLVDSARELLAFPPSLYSPPLHLPTSQSVHHSLTKESETIPEGHSSSIPSPAAKTLPWAAICSDLLSTHSSPSSAVPIVSSTPSPAPVPLMGSLVSGAKPPPLPSSAPSPPPPTPPSVHPSPTSHLKNSTIYSGKLLTPPAAPTPPPPPAQLLKDDITSRTGPYPSQLLPRAPPQPPSVSLRDSQAMSILSPSPPTPPPPPLTPPLKENSTLRAKHTLSPSPPPLHSAQTVRPIVSPSPPPPPPPPAASFSTNIKTPPEDLSCAPTAPAQPPPPPLSSAQAAKPIISPSPPPPPPPPVPSSSSSIRTPPQNSSHVPSAPPPAPPPPLSSAQALKPISSPSPPPPPPQPTLSSSSNITTPPQNSLHVPNAPPPPVPSGKGSGVGNLSSSPSPAPPMPAPPFISPSGAKGKGLSRTTSSRNTQTKKLRPLHWLKLTRAVQGSLWAEAQKSGEAAKAPEIDISELESLFSTAVPNSDQKGSSGQKSGSRASRQKPEKVQLIEHRRAYNCEIMLSKVKVPLHELTSSVLALEDSALDVDQVDNLIKFCPTKEEMELLKGYSGEKEKLGKCEQFFLELMRVPRIESKLRVFSFKMQFCSQVSDTRNNLNVVNSAAEQIRSSLKFKRVMQTILSLGNALNQGTARGSAIGFRLDSLLKLTETRARNNKMTLMHYLCKVLADKLPELLDFSKDLSSLDPASKIQLKVLAEEMQAISKGLEKVIQELSMSENDGPISEEFCKGLKEFLSSAEAEVRSLACLYSGVGRSVDALILYFGEDPCRCTFEQVVSTLLNFTRMFNRAHEENLKQLELEKKKAAKEQETEKLKKNPPQSNFEHLLNSSTKTVD
ncbi:formin-like protein 13 [Diospyros lotus]|uniref:formin-like protein 13 n=1 Tax=Diospyros lotus TaxID=55363 RepID=UPI00225460FF|nr:formin-like protein 13 [Diospyros lotus]